jgi:hypothetical protein
VRYDELRLDESSGCREESQNDWTPLRSTSPVMIASQLSSREPHPEMTDCPVPARL